MPQSELQELIQLQKDTECMKKSYNELKKQYPNQFIAIKDGNIVAHHADMDIILKMIRGKKINPATVFIEFLHPNDMILIL